MERICPHCGRWLNDFESNMYGPYGNGCAFCTTHCVNCGREVYTEDIIYGPEQTYCTYCAAEVEQEEFQITFSIDDDDDDDEEDDDDNKLD